MELIRNIAKQRVFIFFSSRRYVLAIAVIFYLLLKTFAISVYKIPSESMLPNIWPGDWIVVDKIGYSGVVEFWGHAYRLPKFRNIKRGDVMVFHFPEGDTVLTQDPVRNYYELKRWLQYKNKLADLPGYGECVPIPLKYRMAYVKRCVGLPGDTFAIRQGNVVVNGIQLNESWQVRRLFKVYGNTVSDMDLSKRLGIPFNGWRDNKELVMALAADELVSIKNQEGIDSTSVVKDTRFYISRFPFVDGNENYWSPDNFKSIQIPEKGATIPISIENLSVYRRIIEVYEQNKLNVWGDSIFINKDLVCQYTFKQNYYFMMGDNRYFSMDSRNWGFVPEDHVIGRAVMIGWSKSIDGSDEEGIRWNRMGRIK